MRRRISSGFYETDFRVLLLGFYFSDFQTSDNGRDFPAVFSHFLQTFFRLVSSLSGKITPIFCFLSFSVNFPEKSLPDTPPAKKAPTFVSAFL